MSKVMSSRDVLLLGLDSGEQNIREVLADVSREEYEWEPIPLSERAADMLLPPEGKKVWRVYPRDGKWTDDYVPEVLDPPPFTTIAWIMNHIAQTAEMYLYCIKAGKPEGRDRSWDDLPVPSDLVAMRDYIYHALADVREYLVSIPAGGINREMNRLAPAPWGEMRPAYMNIWGGVVEHVLHHIVQIAARKDRIHYGY